MAKTKNYKIVSRAKRKSYLTLKKNIKSVDGKFKQVPKGDKAYISGTEVFLLNDYKWTDGKGKMKNLYSLGGL